MPVTIPAVDHKQCCLGFKIDFFLCPEDSLPLPAFANSLKRLVKDKIGMGSSDQQLLKWEP